MKYKTSLYFKSLIVQYQKYGEYCTPIIRELVNNLELAWKNIPPENFAEVLSQLTNKKIASGEEPYLKLSYSEDCILALTNVRKLFLKDKLYISKIITYSSIAIDENQFDEIAKVVNSIAFNHIFQVRQDAKKDTKLYLHCFGDSTKETSPFETKENDDAYCRKNGK